MPNDASVAPRFTSKPTSSDHFAWVRTRLAAERTMMSWARTAIALIGFGFTIVKFFESLQAMEDVAAARQPQAARYLGLMLIAAGTGALVIALWQYRAVVRYLWQDDFKLIAGMHGVPGTAPVVWAALVLILIGVFAFTAIATRML